jgi:hypothetical protein
MVESGAGEATQKPTCVWGKPMGYSQSYPAGSWPMRGSLTRTSEKYEHSNISVKKIVVQEFTFSNSIYISTFTLYFLLRVLHF